MNKKIIPFIFYNRDCPACGAKKSIVFTDYMNDTVPQISKATDGVYNVRCSVCNKELLLYWDIESGLPGIGDKQDAIDKFEKQFKENEMRDIDDILFGDI